MRYEEKFALGHVDPMAFVVLRQSPIARMYNFKVCERNSEEEDDLARKYDESLQEEEACCIKLDLHIRDLSITQRSKSCNNKKRITFHVDKVQAL